MTQINLAPSDWRRDVAAEAQIPLVNRYYEEDPLPLDGDVALLARPALRKWLTIGAGPIRGIYCQLGTFGDALFVVSGSVLYKILPDETFTILGSAIAGLSGAYVPMCITSVSQDLLFLADGTNLWVYDGTTLSTVAMPDAVGAAWIDTIASFVIVVVAQGFGENGRFYWLNPAEIIINPLNFATAERAPDPLYSVITLGDQFWLFGASTTEVWYPTGDGAAPFQRVQGRLFDKGIWEGTAVKVGDEMIVIDRDGTVWNIGNGVTRVSNYSIEQQVREAMKSQIVAGG